MPASTVAKVSDVEAAPPSGLIEFCQRNDGYCASERKTFKLLREVNDDINHRLRFQTDAETHGRAEYWTLPLTFGESVQGDCEDYVLEKRQELLNRGVPADRLLIAVVHSQRTGLHAVLLYSSAKGDLVLDNTTGAILPWHMTGYKWIKRQATCDDLLSWVYFDGQADA